MNDLFRTGLKIPYIQDIFGKKKQNVSFLVKRNYKLKLARDDYILALRVAYLILGPPTL